MKLAGALFVVLLVYFLVARKLYKEFKSTPKENRKELQTIPLFLSCTFVYVAITWQLVSLSIRGILPLL